MSTETQPHKTVHIHDASIELLGTAHVSRVSADAVSSRLESGNYDAVAVELCPSRYNALLDPDALARMDLFQVMREGKVMMVVASLALGAYQQRLADQFGIEPGAEQRAAIRIAKEKGLPILLIDREIGITLKRVSAAVPWWKRMTLLTGLAMSIVVDEEVSEEEIERLKEGDMLESTFGQFANEEKALFHALIDERDQYMAARLREDIENDGHKNILVVIGAGHLQGTAGYLSEQTLPPREVIQPLDQLPQKKRWPRLIPWIIVAVIISGFIIGFIRSPDLGWQLVLDWVLINGVLSALGALLAAAHPLTILTAFVAAPITSLNPTIGAGMVTAAAEIYLRKPKIGDFSTLKQDTTRLIGWWKNRVSRTLLVFLFSTLGSAAGTYIAGFRIFGRLAGAE
ncbi:MAG: TraB/GumN family protein [gamma proteobacterium symbiont of Bathyaustriella thionipta]|nr:TraB/GumN family protein [gamma proteobacterium symbiont of Bathyaustriella thionipta]